MPQDRPQIVDSSPRRHASTGRGAPHAAPVDSEVGRVASPLASLATAWPEIVSGVPAEDRALAGRALMMPVVTADDADLAGPMSVHTPNALDFLITEGIVLKQTVLVQHCALELLGVGDLLAPPLTAAQQLESRSTVCYHAHGRVSLIAITARFGRIAGHWPAVAEVLHDRLGRQTHRASMHAAMLHLPRIEDRLIALFADFAERFGRVGTAGILLELPLTHETIGSLVGGRRPTVSLALKRLGDQGLVERHGDGRWTLSRSILAA